MSGVFLVKDNDKMEQAQSEKIQVLVKNVNSNGILLQNAKGISLKSGGIKAGYFLQVDGQDANVDIQQAQFVAIENACVEADVTSQFVPLEMVQEGQIIIQDRDVIVWDELCRICANTSDKVVPIFSGEGLEHDLCKKIQSYLPLTVSENDPLPLQVCYNCTATLLAWHEMTKNCLSAQERLTELQNRLNSKNQEPNNVSDGEGVEIVDNEMDMEVTNNQEVQVQDEAEADKQNAQEAEQAVDESETDRARQTFSYMCGVCEHQMYDSEIALMKHMRQEHRQLPRNLGVRYECNVCARVYATKRKLVQHLYMHERGTAKTRKSGNRRGEDEEIESSKVFCRDSHKLLFKCERPDCGAVLKSRRGFLRHMRVHRDERPVICEHCGKSYRIEDDLKRHIDDVHNKIKRHECDICGRSNAACNSTASFKDFRKRYKPSVPAKTRKSTAKSRTKASSSRSSGRVTKVKTAETDDQTSKEKDDLMPVKKEEDSDDDYFEIEIKDDESSTTKSSSSAKRPRRKQKLASPKSLECKQCSKAFRQRKSYDIHMRQHTGEKPFTCHICGKQFSQTGSLYYHLKHLHGGVKNHACDICGRCFAMKTAMEDHRRIHTGERPYVCDVCGKTFKTKASLYIHSKIHTDEYPFNCSYCEKPFRWKQQMISHLTTHTGEKNHICDICNKGFGVKNELTRHRRTHSTDKPFTCQKCGLSFGQKRYLTNHNRTRHKIKSELNVT